jgi:glutamine amidotransferase
MPTTVLIDYGSGNRRSAEIALRRAAQTLGAGHDVVVSGRAEDIRGADRLVLPGVGAFSACMAALAAKSGVVEALREAVGAGAKPFLGVCVGMQLLADEGLERGSAPGLGLISGSVRRLQPCAPTAKVPHVGWNDARPETPSLLWGAQVGPFYFTHSYAFSPTDEAVVTASVDHGGRVAAAVEKDNIAGVQFHPEKSQAEGLAFLARFLSWRV